LVDTPEFRSGFAALVGRPNVGKSTLLNALVGQKLSIVTPRPQTTRHRIIGISNLPNAQIAFVDTPGLHHHASRALNKAMNRTAATALEDADLVVLVIEGLRWTAEDDLVLERIVRSGRPSMVALNKVDLVRPRERLLPYLAELAKRHAFLEIVPVSALKAKNIEDLRKTIAAHLPPAPAMFPDGEVTDRGLQFRISEMIREKLTLELNQEVDRGRRDLGGPGRPEADRDRCQRGAAQTRRPVRAALPQRGSRAAAALEPVGEGAGKLGR
jgi:GTP-binding protein Era